MNFVEVDITGSAAGKAVVAVPTAGLDHAEVAARGTLPETGARVSLGIRPEHFLAEGAGASIEGKVVLVERLGSVTYVHAVLRDGTAIAVESRDGKAFREGQTCRFGIDTEKAFLFDASGARL